MDLDDKQRGVLKGIGTGLGATIGAIGGALATGHGGILVDVGPYSRLEFWGGHALAVTLVLVAFVGALAGHRFFTPEDIDGGAGAGGTEDARIQQAILQNTLEQSVIWLAVSLAWAVRMPVWTMAVIPATAMLFVVGRLLFRKGYRKGAPGRALGFALTFYPSVAMAILLVVEASGLAFQ